MRKLKTILADNKPYTFSTLTLREQQIARKLENLSPEEQTELDALMDGMRGSVMLDNTKNARLLDLQNKQMRNLIKILVMSISKNHADEFAITEKQTEDDVIDKIQNLLDIRDMRRFTSFALLGTLPVEEDESTFVEETIDLTARK